MRSVHRRLRYSLRDWDNFPRSMDVPPVSPPPNRSSGLSQSGGPRSASGSATWKAALHAAFPDETTRNKYWQAILDFLRFCQRQEAPPSLAIARRFFELSTPSNPHEPRQTAVLWFLKTVRNAPEERQRRIPRD